MPICKCGREFRGAGRACSICRNAEKREQSKRRKETDQIIQEMEKSGATSTELYKAILSKIPLNIKSERNDENPMVQGVERELGPGKPKERITLSFEEIDYRCECTWIYDIQSKLHWLKYMTTQCPAMFWHKSQGMATDARRMAADNRRH